MTESPFLDEFPKLYRRALRTGLKVVLDEHHRKVIPDHFKVSAKGKYSYARRKPLTKKIKRGMGKDPDRPLVQTGQLAGRVNSRPSSDSGGGWVGGAGAIGDGWR
jgi:hypothetical protein